MLFENNDKIGNERIIYQSKPSILFGCKKVIYGIIALIIFSFISSKITKYVRDMQVYYVSFVKYPISTCLAILFLILSFIIIIYIIYQLLVWYSTEYILTDSRVILKKGLLYTRKNYMSYNAIQDISSSQSFIAKIFGVSSIDISSAYDNNQIRFNNISDAQKVEEFIFSNMMNNRNHLGSNNYNSQVNHEQNYYNNPYGYRDNYYDNNIRVQHNRNNQYYDFEDPEGVITPKHSRYRDFEDPEGVITPKHSRYRDFEDPEGVITPKHSRYRDFEDPEGVITPKHSRYRDFEDPEGVITPKHSRYRDFEDPEGVITSKHSRYRDDLDQSINNALNNFSDENNNKNNRKPYSKEVGDYFIEIKHEKKEVKNDEELVLGENLVKKHFDKFKK